MADKKTPTEVVQNKRNEIIAKIAECNEILKEGDKTKFDCAEQELRELETTYAEEKAVEVFCELKEQENPVEAAIRMHSYPVVGYKTIREDGLVRGFEIVEDKPRQIDLVKLCKFCDLPTEWQYKVEKFNKLLALRTAEELKMTKAQIKKINDSFSMNELARKIEMGETPTSNTQICKMLQMVLDGILYEETDKGKNKYRVNSHDVAYLLMCYTKRGKKVLSVAVAKNAYIHRLVMDVAHRILTGKTYDLEYKMISQDKVLEKKDEAKAEKKVKAEVADTVVVEKKTA